MIWLLLIPVAVYGLLYVGSPLGSTSKSPRSVALDRAADSIFASHEATRILFGSKTVTREQIRQKLVSRTQKGLEEAASVVRPSSPQVAEAILAIVGA